MEIAYGQPQRFDLLLETVKKKRGVEQDTDLDAKDLKEVVALYKKVYQKNTGKPFPTDPKKQLWGAIDAVFGSWNNDRAIKYREINNIRGLLGTAVNVRVSSSPGLRSRIGRGKYQVFRGDVSTWH